jgi:hypothetical protein
MEKKNIWKVPTNNDDSNLYLGNLDKVVRITDASAKVDKPIFIYITSCDKIKNGDYYLTKHNAIGCHKGADILLFDSDKKIILTTDTKLIEKGIQQMSYSLIEYCINNPIDFISKERIMRLTEEPENSIDRGITITQFISEGEKPKGYTTVIRKLDNGQETEYEDCFYDNKREFEYQGKIFIGGWFHKYGGYIPDVIKWRTTLIEEPKCTCERPDDNTCDYCEEQESKHILSEAKKRAKHTDEIELAVNRIAKLKGYDIEGGILADFVDGFVEGVNWQQEQELDIASGYLNANLENIEKMKSLYKKADMIAFAKYSVGKALSIGSFKPNDDELTKFKSLEK